MLMRFGSTGSALKICSIPLMAALGICQPVLAATDAEVIDALKMQIDALTARLDALETTTKVKTQAYTTPQVSQPLPAAASWTDDIKLKGDFRYRHEAFDIEGREDRHRQRIRARTELNAKVNDTVSVGVGLATGGEDPISSNQTLGSGASSKSVVLDLAYAKWTTPVEGLTVQGGKFKNPFHRAGGTGLIWDGDLRPEGAGLSYDNNMLFAHALGLFIDEDSNGEDAFLIGTQVGLNTEIADGKLMTGIGYYNFTDTEGRTPFFDGDPRGNRVNPDGTYLSGFELIEGFAEYAFTIRDSKVTLFADYVQNLEADDFDTGYSFGVRVKQSDWKFGWAYQDLEADAVLGTLTDSDFIGGGTDGKGHVLQAGYSLTKGIGLNGTLFLNDRNMDFGSEESFKRLMLDISFKY
jgi:hypothetical protein